MDFQKVSVPKRGKILGRVLLIGTVTAFISLMVGLLIQTVAYKIATNIPAVIRQDSHIELPLCKTFPSLSGCDAWDGALTGLEILERSEQAGLIGGLTTNLILVMVFSAWVTVWDGRRRMLPGLLIGITSGIVSLLLILFFVPNQDFNFPPGLIGILMLIPHPLSAWIGSLIGKTKLARSRIPKGVTFQPGENKEISGILSESLTQRELEVLALAAEGYRNTEIAQHLVITEATVKTHLQHIYTKLGVTNRTAAVTRALADGLLLHRG